MAIVSLLAPPWEKPLSRLEVMEEARSRGGIIRGEGNTPHVKQENET